MKPLLYIFFLYSSVAEQINVELLLPKQQISIFCDYQNDNFKQEIKTSVEGTTIQIESLNFFFHRLQFRLLPNTTYIQKIRPELAQVVRELLQDTLFLKDFLRNMAAFIRFNITYSEEDIPQDALSVIINKKANCVGYSNLVSVLLASAGIASRQIKGFYLKSEKNMLIPVSHRWLEIEIGEKIRFFYDPQYQDFSFRYMVVRDGIDFRQIEKFNGYLIRKNKTMSNG